MTDIEAMVQAARAGGIQVALCSILPTDVPFNGNTAQRNALIARVNQRLRGIAQEQGAVYVDYHQQFVASDGVTLRPGFADDGLHPHIVGYDIMATVRSGPCGRPGSTRSGRVPHNSRQHTLSWSRVVASKRLPGWAEKAAASGRAWHCAWPYPRRGEWLNEGGAVPDVAASE